MLCVAPKGRTDETLALSAREDALLRAAFGRYGGSALARRAAAPIVQLHQQIGTGRWFCCDCRPDAPRPPVLVPVCSGRLPLAEAQQAIARDWIAAYRRSAHRSNLTRRRLRFLRRLGSGW